MSCDNCKGTVYSADPVPYVVHENLRAQFTDIIHRLVRVIVLLVLLLVGSLCYTMWLKDQYVRVEESYDIEQDTDGGGSNYIVGGDFNGETEDKSEEEDIHP